MPGSRSTHERNGASDRIRRAGISLFKLHGYDGTSVRALAEAVGLEAASLYHHFPSKQEILYDIFERTMDDFLDGLQRVLGSNASFEERLRATVRFHVLFHIDRRDEAFISHSDLRSLTAANRRRIYAKRDLYETTLRDFLAAGVEAGVFETPDVALTTIAILTMCSSVADWFVDGGRLSAAEVAEAYADMTLRLLRPTAVRRSSGPSVTRKHLRRLSG
jgi:AcrR family transcriptional regulator